MGSIRPLFTITVLVVVGAYLYVKINEGPVRPHAGAQGGSELASDGVPPLAAAGGATLAQDSAAPAWPPATSSAAPTAPILPPGVASAGNANSRPANPSSDADESKTKLPEVPPIPELPELPQTADANPSAATPALSPLTELPKNVPTASYGDEAGPNLGASKMPDGPNGLPALPALSTAIDNTNLPAAPAASAALTSSASGGLPVMPNAATNVGGEAPPMNDRYGAPISPPATSQPLTPIEPPAAQPNDLRTPASNAPVSPPANDRYGVGASSTLPPAATAPLAETAPLGSQPTASAGASFAASWPAIQTALDRHDLKQAHQLLSKWHGDESLSPADAQRVESLLGQLAGTVIYSTEHQLEPARVVKPGETLESIAKEYNVPWQLLAKINSIPAADQVRAGQSLKVVRGPFSAVVDLHRSELTLEVDGRYAGTFPIAPPADAASSEGEWVVSGPMNGLSQPGERALVLQRNERNSPPGQGILLGSISAENVRKIGVPSQRLVMLSAQDAEDISDILSIGSRVIVRR